MSEHIFRAYDVRAVFNKEIDVESVVRIGLAFGTYLGGEGLVFTGRDIRTSSQIVECAAASGICSTGCDVVSLGLLPIPVFNFYIWKSKPKAGLMVTASHNPPEFTGLRFRRSDGTGFSEENNKIKEIYVEGKFIKKPWNQLGKLLNINTEVVIWEYIRYLLDKISLERELKVILDPGTGTASMVAPQLFREAGCKVFTINSQIDGTFPGRDSYPREGTIDDLQKITVEWGADMGVAYDGDADRAVFVDDKGRVVRPETAGVLFIKDALSKKRGKIVANVSSSMIIQEQAEALGGEVVYERVGDVFMTEAMKRHKAIFGIEPSGHFYSNRFYPFDDGIQSSLLLAEIISKQEKALSRLVDEIPKYPMIEETVKCADEKKFKVVEGIKEKLERRGYQLNLMDGVRVDQKEGWFIVRPSNTQPLIRVTVEAKTESKLKELKNEILALLKTEMEKI
ncbi:MAG: phosphoglucosamine mutase [Candidatus Freyarchaeota archaeon]|nr:phosphoglucosamine mutase [Candidatus Jordarchaeia archaeon]MBS7269110.1 phosphoglucosamine mutase [Candidatus Jordarchaeia archaeon]MBS7279940.1 phosphoglucosamine mutase [Candidatus Jordarchaeia archaeon]